MRERIKTFFLAVLFIFILPIFFLWAIFDACLCECRERLIFCFHKSKLNYFTGVIKSSTFRIERGLQVCKCNYQYDANSSIDGSGRFLLDQNVILLDGEGANHYCFNHSGLLSVRRFQKEPLPIDEWLRAEAERSGTECFLCFDDSRDHVRKRVFKALMSHPRTVALSELSDWLKSEQFLLLIDQKGV